MIAAEVGVRPVTESMVHVEKIADCPFSLSLEYASVVFPMLVGPEGVRIPYRTFFLPFRGAFTHAVSVKFACRPDDSEPGRPHDELYFAWNAHSPWLPNFHGLVRFRIAGERTNVMLSGEYVPPLGAFGALFDRVIGHRFALATISDIVDRLTRALEERCSIERGR